MTLALLFIFTGLIVMLVALGSISHTKKDSIPKEIVLSFVASVAFLIALTFYIE